MAWNPFRNILKNQRLDNAEASAVHEIGVDDIDYESAIKALYGAMIKNKEAVI